MSIAESLHGTLRPEWLAHRYDWNRDLVHFVEAPRALRGATPFLTDENLPGAAAPTVLDWTNALRAAPAATPVHYIFHSAYCCSTLLAAALDIENCATSLKEPQILNDMVGWRHRGGDPRAIGAKLHGALHLLSRPFHAGEVCIIKPSNVVNGLAEAMMRLRPDARCLLLYAPLRAFVTSIARKGMWGRLWVRELLSKQLKDGLVNLGFSPPDYLLHTDLQAAAVGWLAQHQLFGAMARRWPDRVRTLDSETFISCPANAMAAISELFGLHLPKERLDRIVSERFTRDAKSGERFEPGQREADRRAGELLHGDEVEKVTIWAEAVASNAGVALDLPAPLLASTCG